MQPSMRSDFGKVAMVLRTLSRGRLELRTRVMFPAFSANSVKGDA